MEKLREKKRLVHFLGGTLAAILALVIGVWIVSAQTTSPVARSTVTVSVTDDLGHSVPGATVTIQGRGQNGNDPATYRQGLTDGTGVLKAELLAAGDYTVVAALGDLSQSTAVNVAEDGESFVQIRLVTMGATVSGRVTNGQSAGVGNVRIVLAGN